MYGKPKAKIALHQTDSQPHKSLRSSEEAFSTTSLPDGSLQLLLVY